MSKNNNNKRRKCKRSKGSQKRKARAKARPTRQAMHNKGKEEAEGQILIADIDGPNLPTIAEYRTVIPADDLGSVNEPGVLAQLITRYFASLQKSVLADKPPKRHTRISFAYTYQSRFEFAAAPRIDGVGGVSLDTLEVLIRLNIDEVAVNIEGGVRDIVARINEEGEETVLCLAVFATETDRPSEDDAGAFGIPDTGLELAAHYESEQRIKLR